MPKPKKNESKQDFLKRCTAEVMDEGKDSKHAYSACNAYWDHAKSQRSALNMTSSPEIAEFKDGDRTREFLITGYTGARVNSWFGDIVVDISGIQTKEKMPILREHARDRVVGYGDAWKEDNFYISGQFSKSTADAKEVLALAEEGYPWQASISVRPTKVERLEDEKTKSIVNGREESGPLEIWRESKVGEVSFVSLGADDNTAAISMSEEKYVVETLSCLPDLSWDNNNNQEKTEEDMEITLDLIKQENPELLVEIELAAEAEGVKKGAVLELERIKSVQEQTIPGHEKLIQTLMFDGKTSGPEAAVKVLAAEKKLRTDTLEQHQGDAPDALPDPSTDTGDITAHDKDLPVEERAKANWEKDPKIRKEFDGDYEAYLAAETAMSAGRVRIIGKK